MIDAADHCSLCGVRTETAELIRYRACCGLRRTETKLKSLWAGVKVSHNIESKSLFVADGTLCTGCSLKATREETRLLFTVGLVALLISVLAYLGSRSLPHDNDHMNALELAAFLSGIFALLLPASAFQYLMSRMRRRSFKETLENSIRDKYKPMLTSRHECPDGWLFFVDVILYPGTPREIRLSERGGF